MSDENLEDLKKKRELLEKEKNSADSIIDIKQKTIEKEAGNIRKIKDIKERMWGISKIYDDADETKIFLLPQEEYNEFIDPLRQITASGASIFGIEDESRLAFTQVEDHEAILVATTSTSGSPICPAISLVGEHPNYFKNPSVIAEKVKAVDELQQHVEYIKSKLPGITPDISKDFDMFLKKYDAFKIDKTKYQEFIASRSMIFYKFIFKPFENVSGADTKRKRIRCFVFGNPTVNPAVEPQIGVALDLWNKLSNQEESVKTGDINITEVENLFRRIIAVLYSLLILRSEYFSVND